MIAFQVTSRTVPGLAPPMRQQRRLSPTWIAIYRVFRSMSISGILFALVLHFLRTDYAFVLLPTFLSVFIVNSRRFPLDQIAHSTPLYLVITALLALVYFSVVTAIVMIPHSIAHSPDIIFVTTTLAWVIILQPAYVYFQSRVERRFNKSNIAASKAVEAFTSTLRDEIDLDQLRERFLMVIQQTMQPYSVSLWLRVTSRQKRGDMQQAKEVPVGDDDPFIAHALHHLGAVDISRLPQESSLVQGWRAQGIEMVLPLATQGDLIGLLVLSMRLDGEDYSLEDRTLLGTLATEVAPALRVAQLVQEQQEQVREH
ncbi:MAG TPA: GAF domain-containing protein [Ktedonobacterales bacterium]|nr:GAF domain-containing protein [Ktedonobacterales bacterium]